MMDFHAMKRKQLQALCKRHKIPANLSNVEMANRLSSVLNIEDADSLEEQAQPSLKNGDGEGTSAGDKKTNNGVVKLVKKVKFSPQNETFEYVRSDRRAIRLAARRRRSVALASCSTNEEVIDRETKAEPSRRTRTKSGKVDAEGVVPSCDVYVDWAVEKKSPRKTRTRKRKNESDDDNIDNAHIAVESELKEKRREEGVNGVEQVSRRSWRMLGKTGSNDTLDKNGVSVPLPVAKRTSGRTRTRNHENEKITKEMEEEEEEDEKEKNNTEQKGTRRIQKRCKADNEVKVSVNEHKPVRRSTRNATKICSVVAPQSETHDNTTVGKKVSEEPTCDVGMVQDELNDESKDKVCLLGKTVSVVEVSAKNDISKEDGDVSEEPKRTHRENRKKKAKDKAGVKTENVHVDASSGAVVMSPAAHVPVGLEKVSEAVEEKPLSGIFASVTNEKALTDEGLQNDKSAKEAEDDGVNLSPAADNHFLKRGSEEARSSPEQDVQNITEDVEEVDNGPILEGKTSKDDHLLRSKGLKEDQGEDATLPDINRMTHFMRNHSPKVIDSDNIYSQEMQPLQVQEDDNHDDPLEDIDVEGLLEYQWESGAASHTTDKANHLSTASCLHDDMPTECGNGTEMKQNQAEGWKKTDSPESTAMDVYNNGQDPISYWIETFQKVEKAEADVGCNVAIDVNHQNIALDTSALMMVNEVLMAEKSLAVTADQLDAESKEASPATRTKYETENEIAVEDSDLQCCGRIKVTHPEGRFEELCPVSDTLSNVTSSPPEKRPESDGNFRTILEEKDELQRGNYTLSEFVNSEHDEKVADMLQIDENSMTTEGKDAVELVGTDKDKELKENMLQKVEEKLISLDQSAVEAENEVEMESCLGTSCKSHLLPEALMVEKSFAVEAENEVEMESCLGTPSKSHLLSEALMVEKSFAVEAEDVVEMESCLGTSNESHLLSAKNDISKVDGNVSEEPKRTHRENRKTKAKDNAGVNTENVHVDASSGAVVMSPAAYVPVGLEKVSEAVEEKPLSSMFASVTNEAAQTDEGLQNDKSDRLHGGKEAEDGDVNPSPAAENHFLKRGSEETRSSREQDVQKITEDGEEVDIGPILEGKTSKDDHLLRSKGLKQDQNEDATLPDINRMTHFMRNHSPKVIDSDNIYSQEMQPPQVQEDDNHDDPLEDIDVEGLLEYQWESGAASHTTDKANHPSKASCLHDDMPTECGNGTEMKQNQAEGWKKTDSPESTAMDVYNNGQDPLSYWIETFHKEEKAEADVGCNVAIDVNPQNIALDASALMMVNEVLMAEKSLAVTADQLDAESKEASPATRTKYATENEIAVEDSDLHCCGHIKVTNPEDRFEELCPVSDTLCNVTSSAPEKRPESDGNFRTILEDRDELQRGSDTLSDFVNSEHDEVAEMLRIDENSMTTEGKDAVELAGTDKDKELKENILQKVEEKLVSLDQSAVEAENEVEMESCLGTSSKSHLLPEALMVEKSFAVEAENEVEMESCLVTPSKSHLLSEALMVEKSFAVEAEDEVEMESCLGTSNESHLHSEALMVVEKSFAVEAMNEKASEDPDFQGCCSKKRWMSPEERSIELDLFPSSETICNLAGASHENRPDIEAELESGSGVLKSENDEKVAYKLDIVDEQGKELSEPDKFAENLASEDQSPKVGDEEKEKADTLETRYSIDGEVDFLRSIADRSAADTLASPLEDKMEPEGIIFTGDFRKDPSLDEGNDSGRCYINTGELSGLNNDDTAPSSYICLEKPLQMSNPSAETISPRFDDTPRSEKRMRLELTKKNDLEFTAQEAIKCCQQHNHLNEDVDDMILDGFLGTDPCSSMKAPTIVPEQNDHGRDGGLEEETWSFGIASLFKTSTKVGLEKEKDDQVDGSLEDKTSTYGVAPQFSTPETGVDKMDIQIFVTSSASKPIQSPQLGATRNVDLDAADLFLSDHNNEAWKLKSEAAKTLFGEDEVSMDVGGQNLEDNEHEENSVTEAKSAESCQLDLLSDCPNVISHDEGLQEETVKTEDNHIAKNVFGTYAIDGSKQIPVAIPSEEAGFDSKVVDVSKVKALEFEVGSSEVQTVISGDILKSTGHEDAREYEVTPREMDWSSIDYVHKDNSTEAVSVHEAADPNWFCTEKVDGMEELSVSQQEANKKLEINNVDFAASPMDSQIESLSKDDYDAIAPCESHISYETLPFKSENPQSDARENSYKNEASLDCSVQGAANSSVKETIVAAQEEFTGVSAAWSSLAPTSPLSSSNVSDLGASIDAEDIPCELGKDLEYESANAKKLSSWVDEKGKGMRNVIIYGTPVKKVIQTGDMKENYTPSMKRFNATVAVRPSGRKRKALEELLI